MDKAAQYLISKDSNSLQISYEDYKILMEKAAEARRVRSVRDEVLAALEAFLDGRSEAVVDTDNKKEQEGIATPANENSEGGKVEEPEEPVKAAETLSAKPAATEAPADINSRAKLSDIEIPPIKEEIAEHFNKLDESGRLLNVFRQYYTCLNDSCGSTVRVTMKDGFCSLWNYDEWEEFAFVDIFEGNLRFGLDPLYAEALSALSICEVPRYLSRNRKLICVKTGDLNNTILNVLAKAFKEVGLTAS